MITDSVPSVRANCDECGAEVVFTALFQPEHRQLSPVCPFCQFPMTKEITAAEIVAEMGRRLRQFDETLREVRT